VTNGRSDDADSTHLGREDIHLRIARTGSAFALHASHDGTQWALARYFILNEANDTRVRLGIAAQSSAGQGTPVTFSEFGWEAVAMSDTRDGS